MITFDKDAVVNELKTEIKFGLEEVNYTGPLKATEGGLTDDLIDGLVEIIFEVLSNCLNLDNSPAEIAQRAKNINGLQQVAINIKIRNRLFNRDRRAYASAGGSKISDGAITALNKTEEGKIQKLVEYVRDGSKGLTIYPEL